MKRIAIVSTAGIRWGGSEELWYRIAKKLLQQGHQVLISVFKYTPLHPKIYQLQQEGAKLSLRSLPSYVRDISIYQRAIGEIKLQLQNHLPLDMLAVKQFKPDVVLISSAETFDYIFHADTWLWKYLTQNKIPYCLISQFNWEHDLDVDESFRTSHQQMVKEAKAFFFVSERNKQHAERQIAMCIPQAFVINNPINISSPELLRFPKPDTWMLACVARLQTFFKGQDLLLSVLAKEKWQHRNWQLGLYGKGKDYQHLINLIHWYKLEGKVILHGHVDDIKEVWRKHHLLVLPSLAEGTPLALLEAMSCGRTAVVTDVGDSAEYLGKNGFISPAATPQLLEDTLEKAWLKKEQWEVMGEKCFEYIINNVDLEIENYVIKTML